MVARAREPSSSVTSRPTASRPAWTTTRAIPAPIVPRPTTPMRRISTARDPTRMADDVLAILRELESRPWALAAPGGIAGARKAGEKPASRPQPAGDASQQRPDLLLRQVVEHVEGDDRVEALRRQLDGGEVAVDQRRSREPLARTAQLLAGEVDAGQTAALREDPARLHARSDAELEHVRPLGHELQQVGEPGEARLVRDPALPLGERVGDGVVAALDDALGVVVHDSASSIARRPRSNCSALSRTYEWRPRLRGITPAASTGGASRRSRSATRGRIANRHCQRTRDGSFSGCETTSTTAKTTCQPAA